MDDYANILLRCGPLVGLAVLALGLGACAAPVSIEQPDVDHSELQQPGGETAPDFDGSIDAYVDYALRHHPTLRAEHAQWRAEAASARAVYDWPEPMLSYGLYIRHVETRVGPQRHRFGLEQPIPWPSKPAAASEAAAARANAQKARFDASMLMVRKQVADGYWHRWLLARKKYWKEQQLKLLDSLEATARARYEVGKSPQSDVQQISLSMTRLRDDIEQLARAQRAARARFIERLGLQNAESVPVDPGRVPVARIPAADESELVEKAISHPELVAIEKTIEAAERRAKRAGLDAYPDFKVGVNYIETGEANNPDMPESGKDPIIAMVGVKIPLWFNQYSSEVESVRARSEAQKARLESARNDAAARVRELLAQIYDSARRIHLYENTLIPQAETTYDSVLGRYEVEETTIASVLMAERELLRLRLDLAAARARHARRWIALEQRLGQPVESRRYQP